jgi:amidase
MGARLFAGNVAGAGSPFTERLDAAGLVALGKSATSELGLLGSTETLLEGVTHNPWDLSLSAAGSSGGAAAAVASGMVPLAHANDAGGSIRIPASVTGLFGFKPSRGRTVAASEVQTEFGDLVSDHCISRSVRDSALFLSITEAVGPQAPFPEVGWVQGPSPRRLRVGVWSRTLMGTEPEPEPRRALDEAAALLARLGHHVEHVAPPTIDGAAVSNGFFTLAGATLGGFFETLRPMLGRAVGAGDLEPFTLELVAHAKRLPPEALARAVGALRAAGKQYLEAIAAHDVVLTPTLATEPWRLGWLSPCLSRVELVRRTEQAVGYTPIHNIAGCPAMSVPLHVTPSGLPIGAHFAAAPGAETSLLALAYELEEAAPWADRWPPYSYPALPRA